MSNKTAASKRKGVGRPKSGRNTVTISFSVHKDFATPVKETVRQKVAELKAVQATPPSESAPKTPIKPTKSTKSAPINDAAYQFLEQRRSQKAGNGKKNVKEQEKGLVK